MPLQPHAQREVNQKLEELSKAFFTGFQSDGTWPGFANFLEVYHPTLSNYFQDWKRMRSPLNDHTDQH
jgi:hypothetical protein